MQNSKISFHQKELDEYNKRQHRAIGFLKKIVDDGKHKVKVYSPLYLFYCTTLLKIHATPLPTNVYDYQESLYHKWKNQYCAEKIVGNIFHYLARPATFTIIRDNLLKRENLRIGKKKPLPMKASSSKGAKGALHANSSLPQAVNNMKITDKKVIGETVIGMSMCVAIIHALANVGLLANLFKKFCVEDIENIEKLKLSSKNSPTVMKQYELLHELIPLIVYNDDFRNARYIQLPKISEDQAEIEASELRIDIKYYIQAAYEQYTHGKYFQYCSKNYPLVIAFVNQLSRLVLNEIYCRSALVSQIHAYVKDYMGVNYKGKVLNLAVNTPCKSKFFSQYFNNMDKKTPNKTEVTQTYNHFFIH